MPKNNRPVILKGWIHDPYGGNHFKLTRGAKSRSKTIRLPRFPRLAGKRVIVSITLV